MKKPEILAPAGNMETLKAAIAAGCDAVYLGGKFFGARNFAQNFTREEIKEAIAYAHLYGVKVYITMNTMVYESEMDAFVEEARFYHQQHVDAIIIQDVGAAHVLKMKFPNLKLHASTQMHLHNEDGIAFAESFGFERAVVARETPLSLLKKMKQNSNIELEVFVHGALCMSYSGQCLMSSLLNGRSGNRGTCSQCCRMPYDLVVDDKVVNQNKYILSPKDLNTLPFLQPLLELGIDSFKIEGRMKRKEYVYQVVKIYRQAVDSYFETGKVEVDEKEVAILKTLFNREFTKGFLNEEKMDAFVNGFRPNHLGVEIGKVVKTNKVGITINLTKDLHKQDGIRILGKEDVGMTVTKLFQHQNSIEVGKAGETLFLPTKEKVKVGSTVVVTTDASVIQKIDAALKQEKKIPIVGKVSCREQKLVVEVSDFQNQVTVESDCLEKAKTTKTTKEQIDKGMQKTGATPFVFEKLEIEMEEQYFIPLVLINQLRRKALEELSSKRKYQIPFVEKEYTCEVPEVKEPCGKVAFVSDQRQVEGYAEVIRPYFLVTNEEEVARLPRVTEKVPQVKGKCLLGEWGSVYHYQKGYTDFSLNVANSYTVAYLHSIGIKRITLSLELNDYQIRNIVEGYKNRYQKEPNLEVMVSYLPEVMILKYDLLQAHHIDQKEAILRDYQKREYQVQKENQTTTIYHYKKIEKENPEHYFDLGISKIRFEV